MFKYYIQDNLIKEYKITNIEPLCSISGDFSIYGKSIIRNKSPPSTIDFQKN